MKPKSLVRRAGLAIALLCACCTCASVAAAQSSSVEKENKKQQRLEEARRYLLRAGIEAPAQLDIEHLSQLRQALQAWDAQPTASIEPTASVDSESPGANKSAEGSPLVGQASNPLPFNVFYPSVGQRFVNLFQLQTSLQQQPGSILINGQPSPNPDHVLYQVSLLGDLSQLFLSTSDLASVYQSFEKFAPSSGSSSGQAPIGSSNLFATGPCPIQNLINPGDKERDDFIDCLTRSRPRDMWGRVAAGSTFTLSYGENPQVQQGVLVQPGTPAAAANHLFSGGLNFDPKSLLPIGTDWANAAKALGAGGSDAGSSGSAALGLFQQSLREHCGLPKDGTDNLVTDQCLKTVAGVRKSSAVIGALVPAINFKVQTQFDYFKNGGQFILGPVPQNHLWTLSFTNDLRKFIPTVGARGDAATALKAVKMASSLASNGDCHLPPLPGAQGDNFYSFNLDDEGQTSRHWQLQGCTPGPSDPRVAKKPVCSLSGLSLTPSGVLSGYPTGTTREIELKVKVSDSAGATQSCEAKLEVARSFRMRASDELLLDYVKIAVSPEVVLDEPWYQEFTLLAEKLLVPRKPMQTAETTAQDLPPQS